MVQIVLVRWLDGSRAHLHNLGSLLYEPCALLLVSEFVLRSELLVEDTINLWDTLGKDGAAVLDRAGASRLWALNSVPRARDVYGCRFCLDRCLASVGFV